MIIRKVFLDDLPRGGGCVPEDKINWTKSIGYKVHFIYDDCEGDMEIIDYDWRSKRLTIKYNDYEPFSTLYKNFTQCSFGKYLNRVTIDFKVEIGTTFEDEKRNLIIIDRKYEKNSFGQLCKMYKYHCNKCGNEDWIIEAKLLTCNVGCNVCCCISQKVLQGFNDIWTTDRWMVDLGVPEDVAKTHSRCSTEYVTVTCPLCGNKKRKKLTDIYGNKSIGCICSDSVSYSEKFMIHILSKLNVNYIYQLSSKHFKWIGKKKYDFYLPDQKCIIETNGIQHYKDDGWGKRWSRGLQEEQENDLYKKNLALSNGVDEENYIILDCRNSEMEWIKNSIMNSNLPSILNFTEDDIDWIECEKYTITNLGKEICDYWNSKDDIVASDIAKVFQISRTTVQKYLEKGSKFGWCSYDKKEETLKKNKKFKDKNKKSVEVFKDNISLGVFYSITELSKKSSELFGVTFTTIGISDSANGKTNKYKGFIFKFL